MKVPNLCTAQDLITEAAVVGSATNLVEQKRIVAKIEEQFEVIEQNEREIGAALKRSEALRQSILKKAFTGQLVPQDPADEPASELLERIRARREAEPAGKIRREQSGGSDKLGQSV